MIKSESIKFDDLPDKLKASLPSIFKPPRSMVKFEESKGSYIVNDMEGFLNKTDVKIIANIPSLIAIKQNADGIIVLFKK